MGNRGCRQGNRGCRKGNRGCRTGMFRCSKAIRASRADKCRAEKCRAEKVEAARSSGVERDEGAVRCPQSGPAG
eukprot:3167798-Prymnesium_polylepis.1